MSDTTGLLVTWYLDRPEDAGGDAVLAALNRYFGEGPGLARVEGHAGGTAPVACAVAMGTFEELDTHAFARYAVEVADRLARHGSLSWLQAYSYGPAHYGWHPLAAFEL